jgi:TRAP-type C4-dicarboxylate transport system permease small subunit
MRYFINKPILGDMELIQIMLVGMASFSMAYCANTKSHVRVKALIELIPCRPRSIINFIINIINFGFILLVVRYSAAQGMALWKRGFSTIIFNIPLFPFAFVLSLGFAVFAFVIFVDLIESLAKIFDYEPN